MSLERDAKHPLLGLLSDLDLSCSHLMLDADQREACPALGPVLGFFGSEQESVKASDFRGYRDRDAGGRTR